MKELLIESKGIKTDQYFIPPFELREGELVIICIENTVFFDEIRDELTAIFEGLKRHKDVTVIKPLTFTSTIEEAALKKIFNPMTVGGYLKRNADIESSVVSRIFQIDIFSQKDKVKNLDNSERKRLSLCAAFSKTKNVSFDLRGEGAEFFMKTYEFAKYEIQKGGAAILIDWTDELKNDCSKFVTLEWTVDKQELKKILDKSVKLSKMC